MPRLSRSSGPISYALSTENFDSRMQVLRERVDADLHPLLHKSFTRRVKTRYIRILDTEYPEAKELDTLMRGEVIRRGREIFCVQFKTGGARTRVGSTSDGRLIHGSFFSIRRAIRADPVRFLPLTSAHVLRVGAANASAINAQTFFSWDMVVNGKQYARGATQPFGNQYLQVLENGGAVSRPNFGKILNLNTVTRTSVLYRRGDQWAWRIRHRHGKRLWPEKNVFVWEMEKTVQPIGMFRRALFSEAPGVMRDLKVGLSRRLTNTYGFGKVEG